MKEGPAYTVINSRPAGSESVPGCREEIPWIPAIADPAGAGGAFCFSFQKRDPDLIHGIEKPDPVLPFV
jgi:hypothetical protein